MEDWTGLTATYTGWGLEEIKSLSPRERVNWLTLARMRRKGTSGG